MLAARTFRIGNRRSLSYLFLFISVHSLILFLTLTLFVKPNKKLSESLLGDIDEMTLDLFEAQPDLDSTPQAIDVDENVVAGQ